jgi:hypothetical protein
MINLEKKSTLQLSKEKWKELGCESVYICVCGVWLASVCALALGHQIHERFRRPHGICTRTHIYIVKMLLVFLNFHDFFFVRMYKSSIILIIIK